MQEPETMVCYFALRGLRKTTYPNVNLLPSTFSAIMECSQQGVFYRCGYSAMNLLSEVNLQDIEGPFWPLPNL